MKRTKKSAKKVCTVIPM